MRHSLTPALYLHECSYSTGLGNIVLPPHENFEESLGFTEEIDEKAN